MSDLYAELGVPKTADADTIKKAFRKLARELHPDKNQGNAAAEARFKRVNHANEVLSDPKKRALYDEFGEDALREGFNADQARAARAWGGGGRSAGRGRPAGGFGEEDLFSQFFGGGRGRMNIPGSDLEAEVEVSFLDALSGTELDLNVQGRSVRVRIPKGAGNGDKLKIAGQGGASPMGGPNGDLHLHVHVAEHPIYKREGLDLRMNVPLTLTEAYFGTKVDVPTPTGAVRLTVPAGTSSGTVVRLRGKGVERGKSKGDLYANFELKLPPPSDDADKAMELLRVLGPEGVCTEVEKMK